MSDPNKKTLIEIVYYFANPLVTAQSPFIGELFTLDAEQGDEFFLNNFMADDTIVLSTKVQTQTNGTKKILPGSRVTVSKGYLWRTVTEVTRERKDTDPVREA